MSRIGTVGGGAAGAAAGGPAPLKKLARGGGVGSVASVGAVDPGAARRERALEGLGAPSVDDEMAAELLSDASETLADPAILRPAGVRAVLEELQKDLAAMQAAAPEDLIELALGVLEDELRNAERLQQILQRTAR